MQVDVTIYGGIQVEVDLPVNFISEAASVDVNYSDGSPSPLGSIEAPGSVNIPLHTMVDSAGTPLDTGEYDDTLVAPDGSIEDNLGTPLGVVKSGGLFTFQKVGVRQQDDAIAGYGSVRQNMGIKGTNFNIASVTQVGDDIEIESEVAASTDILYKQIIYDQDATYNPYDIGWWVANRPDKLLNPAVADDAIVQELDMDAAEPFITLKHKNIHGNYNRLTAQDGTHNFIVGGVIQDHLYYMEWINTHFANQVLTTHLGNAEADTTDGGATNHWRLACRRSMESIIDDNSTTGFPSELPFAAVNTWTSSRYKLSTTSQIYNWGGSLFTRRAPGTYAYQGCYCRRGTW